MDVAHRTAVLEIVRLTELRELLGCLERANVPVLVFKGEHLAHIYYDRPEQRPRLDSDLLIHPDDREKANSSLESRGFRRVPQMEASLISYQDTWTKGAIAVDLHWRVTNAHQFAGTFPGDELLASSRPIPGLGRAARGPDPANTLLLALVHPVAHHVGHERAQWDHDVELVTQRFSRLDWQEFVALVHRRQVSALAAARLRRAGRVSGAVVPTRLLADLDVQAASERGAQVAGAPGTLRGVFSNLRALPAWTERAALVRQHLLPPRAYMRDVYAPASRAPLALLYVRRAITGAWRYCRPAG